MPAAPAKQSPFLKLSEVSEASGLTPRFIRRLLKKAPELFAACQRRGPSNAILIDPNALKIFRFVGEKKKLGTTVQQALLDLKASGLVKAGKTGQTEAKSLANPDQPPAPMGSKPTWCKS